MISYKEFSIERLEEVKRLFTEEEWFAYLNDDEKLIRAFQQSCYLLGAFDQDRLVGFVRCLGDGEHFIAVQDLIVDQNYQRQGIGTKLFQLSSEKFKTVRMFQVNTDLFDERDNAFYRKMGMHTLEQGQMISYYR